MAFKSIFRDSSTENSQDDIMRIMENNYKLATHIFGAESEDDPEGNESYSYSLATTVHSSRNGDIFSQREVNNDKIERQCKSISDFILSDDPKDDNGAAVLANISKFMQQKEYNFRDQPYKNLRTFLLNESEYPFGLNLRRPNQLLRPVFIDGCGATFSFDVRTKPCFLTECSSYDRHRVLQVRRLIHLIIHFVLRGHIVKVLIPSYYEIPYFKNILQAPLVDCVTLFEQLKQLDLFYFIDLEGDHTSLLERIKKAVDEVKACFITRPDVWEHYTKNAVVYDTDSSQEDALKNARFAPCSMRMLTPYYLTNSDIFVIHQAFSHASFDPDESMEAPKAVSKVEAEIMLEYNEPDFETPSSEIRESQQLLFRDQIKMLLELCKMDDFPPDTVRAMQMLFKIAASSDVQHLGIQDFIIQYN